MKFKLVEARSNNFSNNMDTQMIQNLQSDAQLEIPDPTTKCSTSAVYYIKKLLDEGKTFKLCFGQFLPINKPKARINHVWIECEGKIIQTNNPSDKLYPQYCREISSIDDAINFIKELQ